MNRIFQPRGYFTVPDGTDVSAFLTATDVTQDDIPWEALGEMSIAAGRIGPKVLELPLLDRTVFVRLIEDGGIAAGKAF